MSLEDRMSRFAETDLYVVITESCCGERTPEQVLDEVLGAGVGLVQLREKHLDDATLLQRAGLFRERTRDANALLIIDDRVDVALAVEADGVHLGLEDLPVEAAKRIAPELITGASSHCLDEAKAAQDTGADYVNIGPIFPTQTKSVPTGAVGPEMIDTIRPHLRIPFTCMGGIKPDNVGRVLAKGAKHVAVVTAVTAAQSPYEAALKLRNAIRGM